MEHLFSKRLKKAIESKGITQSELAKSSGIRASSISDYLTGKYAPKQDKIYLLAKALGVTPGWLMGYDEAINSSPTYYTDPEAAEYAEELRTNPNMRILFDATKNISKEDMKKTVEYVKFLKLQSKDGE